MGTVRTLENQELMTLRQDLCVERSSGLEALHSLAHK